MNTNPESIERFLEAQELDYHIALGEIKAGKKTSHWMWYIFPQLRGLGHSINSYVYGIRDLDEAKEYLANPILSARLVEICEALLSHAGTEPEFILGFADAGKLRSSMTLFTVAGGGDMIFKKILNAFYGGIPDDLTLKMLNVDPLEFGYDFNPRNTEDK